MQITRQQEIALWRGGVAEEGEVEEEEEEEEEEKKEEKEEENK